MSIVKGRGGGRNTHSDEQENHKKSRSKRRVPATNRKKKSKRAVSRRTKQHNKGRHMGLGTMLLRLVETKSQPRA